MNPHETIAAITKTGIVGIVRAESAQQAIELTRQLWDAGIAVVEVALTTPDGLEAIKKLSQDVPDGYILGAGTILDAATARLAILAGASLLVTPVVVEEVIEVAQRYGAVTVIGAATPTEMLQAHSRGADFVKVFPASRWTPQSLSDTLQALPQLRIIPTGGVTPETAAEWVGGGAVAVGLGSSLTKGDDPSGRVASLLQALGSARA
ncbi:bifunctional 4-hydroxy-2-oxoglutarate aldolase/2-dehydro-3-deoxy-phosphogluconate aldolase [Paenarthrobacter sp. NPDC089675]|uniref:bifunctional 4-hydroxy-2-oxoglutarate aldolase/2-dehydro-3-deoxy-phosphogluconate aldolase n=1 Tax=Paenarthrobacter TaxID=1742992 RepID=UPI00380D6169